MPYSNERRRETKKEKNLEVRQREIKLKAKNGARRANNDDKGGDAVDKDEDDLFTTLEKEFMDMTSAEL